MNKFSNNSLMQLQTCHDDLQKLAYEVLKTRDFAVLCGHRNQQDQDAAFNSGASQVKWPDGNHNKLPSTAFDLMPVVNGIRITADATAIAKRLGITPSVLNLDVTKKAMVTRLVQEEREVLTYFAGLVVGIAVSLGIRLRWGGDWDGDGDLCDNKFDDLFHFELLPETA